MTSVYLNIGSNQGDRHAQIEQAVALIAAAFPQAHLRRSEYIESEPWGYASEHRYLNIGIALDFDTPVEPFQMLCGLQRIEKCISDRPHRKIDGTYADRGIDIDMISIPGVRVTSSVLTLPHPRAHLRDFVMIPLRQLGGEL